MHAHNIEELLLLRLLTGEFSLVLKGGSFSTMHEGAFRPADKMERDFTWSGISTGFRVIKHAYNK